MNLIVSMADNSLKIGSCSEKTLKVLLCISQLLSGGYFTTGLGLEAAIGAGTSTHAEYRDTTDDISLLNTYYYRLADRASVMDPSQRYSHNFKPVSIRESTRLFENRARLSDFKAIIDRYYDRREAENISDGPFLLKPLKEIHGQGVYSEKEDAPLLSNYGNELDGRYYGSLIAGGNAYLMDWVVAGYNLRFSNDADEGVDTVDFWRYKLKTGFDHISIAAAKENVVIGPGHFGNLISSSNVQPENGIIIKTEVPYDWGFLGAFRWYVWHTWYDDDERSNRDPKVMGARVSLMPGNLWELSITRFAMFGGSNNDNFDSLEAYWKMFTAEDENQPGSRYNSQQQMSGDLTIYLPLLKYYTPFYGGKLYGEYAFTDLRAFWQPEDKEIFEPLSESWLIGLMMTTGRTDVHLEYVKVHRKAYGGSGGIGDQGVSDNGYLIGHVAGIKTSGLQGEIYSECLPWLHLHAGLGYFDHVKKDSNNMDNVYDHQQEWVYSAGLHFFIRNGLSIDTKVEYRNANDTDTNPDPVVYSFNGEGYHHAVFSLQGSYYF